MINMDILSGSYDVTVTS